MNINKFINNKHFITILLVISILFLVIFIIKTLYNHKSQITSNSVVLKNKKATIPKTIYRKDLPVNIYGHEYSYSLWMYINNWSYKLNEPKHIFHIGDSTANNASLGVWIDADKNDVIIKSSSNIDSRIKQENLE